MNRYWVTFTLVLRCISIVIFYREGKMSTHLSVKSTVCFVSHFSQDCSPYVGMYQSLNTLDTC
jgi:hypothetical protein